MAKADITIQGRAYSVACAPGQEARLGVLAVDLDRRISGISSAVGDIGEARLLLVAALALLDELEAAKRAGPATPEFEVKAVEAITNAATRIAALADRVETGQ